LIEQGQELWSLAANKPGLLVNINNNTYFVEYKLDQNMKSTFYNKFECGSSDSPGQLCNELTCQARERQWITDINKTQFPICWRQEIPECQDGGAITQLIKFDDGKVEPLYEIKSTSDFNKVTYELNKKVKFNFSGSTTDETSCLGKSNSFLTDLNCKPIQLLPSRGCVYSDWNTDLGYNETGNSRGDYYLDYCNPNNNRELTIKDCPEN
jgi:hypothetical protein